jgi:hypothetical protein
MKKKKLTPKKKTKETLSIELDGKINLVTRKNKKVTREELDGKVCLEVIISAIVQGMDLLEKDLSDKQK